MFSEIDECESSPCLNEATCVDLVDSFECQCVAGFAGTTCETGNESLLVKYEKSDLVLPLLIS